jgi:hypothetical protein
MLNEDTILITSNLGPYSAIGFGGTKEQIEQTLTPFYNTGAFDGEVQFKSDVFGYITGPQEMVMPALIRHFEIQEIAKGKSYKKLSGKRRGNAVRAAQKVWANRKVEHFLLETPASSHQYRWPKFEE